MPFGGWFNDYYSSIYAPAIEAAGLEPNRADDLYRPSTIVSDIWDYTRNAKFILADLSGKNPNVFYELGLAHALAKPAILVVESMDDIPFDLRALRVLEYDKNDSDWGNILRKKIEQAIQEVLVAPEQSVPAAFVDTPRPQKSVTLTSQEKDVLEIRQELDLLRRQFSGMPSRNRSTEEYIPPSEARRRIRRYFEEGVSEGLIHNRLVRRGVPTDFIDSTLIEIRENQSALEIALKELPKKKRLKKPPARKRVAKKRSSAKK